MSIISKSSKNFSLSQICLQFRFTKLWKKFPFFRKFRKILILVKFRFGWNFRKISIWVKLSKKIRFWLKNFENFEKNYDFSQIFEKFRFRSKFPKITISFKNLEIFQLSEPLENFDFGKIFKKFRFWSNFRKISFLVKIFENFEKFRFCFDFSEKFLYLENFEKFPF